MVDSESQHNEVSPAESGDKNDDESYANNYAIAIALGLPFGLLIGLLLLDNITWGILIGAGFAPIIAMVMTMNQKKADA